jgi:hypothetical protein
MTSLSKTYDKRANVLYISIGDPTPAVSVPLRSGVLVRADRKTGEFVGVTLIDVDASREQDYERVLTEYSKVPRDILPALFAQIADALRVRRRG